MGVEHGSTPVVSVKYGTTDITSIYIGSDLVWSGVTGLRDDFDRADSVGLGPGWTDRGPAVTPNLASVFSNYCRINLIDDPSVLTTQTDRQVYILAAPGDDGYVETVPLTDGSPSLKTTVWRRANSTLTNAVGMQFLSGQVTIVSRISNVEVLRTTPMDVTIGSIVRLTQVGDVHSLTVSHTTKTWNDATHLASRGGTFRSMALTVEGSRILSKSQYVRQYSPTLKYVEMS